MEVFGEKRIVSLGWEVFGEVNLEQENLNWRCIYIGGSVSGQNFGK